MTATITPAPAAPAAGPPATGGETAGYAFGPYRVDTVRRVITRDGRPVGLTPIEFTLLLALLRRRGGVATRDELEAEVWAHPTHPASRVIDRHVARLRRKLEPNTAYPMYVMTVPRVGYRIALA